MAATTIREPAEASLGILPRLLKEHVEACHAAGDLRPWLAPRGGLPQPPLVQLAEGYRNYLLEAATTDGQRERAQDEATVVVQVVGECCFWDAAALGSEAVDGWLEVRRRRDGLAAITVEHYRNYMKAFGRWLESEGHLARNPWGKSRNKKYLLPALEKYRDAHPKSYGTQDANLVQRILDELGLESLDELTPARARLWFWGNGRENPASLSTRFKAARRVTGWLNANELIDADPCAGLTLEECQYGDSQAALRPRSKSARETTASTPLLLGLENAGLSPKAIGRVKLAIVECGFERAEEVKPGVFRFWFDVLHKSDFSSGTRLHYDIDFRGFLKVACGDTGRDLASELHSRKLRDRKEIPDLAWILHEEYHAIDRPTYHNLKAILALHGAEYPDLTEKRIGRLIERVDLMQGYPHWPAGSFELLCDLFAYWTDRGLTPSEVRDRWNSLPWQIRVAIAGRNPKHNRRIPKGKNGLENIKQRIEKGRLRNLSPRARWVWNRCVIDLWSPDRCYATWKGSPELRQQIQPDYQRPVTLKTITEDLRKAKKVLGERPPQNGKAGFDGEARYRRPPKNERRVEELLELCTEGKAWADVAREYSARHPDDPVSADLVRVTVTERRKQDDPVGAMQKLEQDPKAYKMFRLRRLFLDQYEKQGGGGSALLDWWWDDIPDFQKPELWPGWKPYKLSRGHGQRQNSISKIHAMLIKARWERKIEQAAEAIRGGGGQAVETLAAGGDNGDRRDVTEAPMPKAAGELHVEPSMTTAAQPSQRLARECLAALNYFRKSESHAERLSDAQKAQLVALRLRIDTAASEDPMTWPQIRDWFRANIPASQYQMPKGRRGKDRVRDLLKAASRLRQKL